MSQIKLLTQEDEEFIKALSSYRAETDPLEVYRDHVERVHADNPKGLLDAAYHIFGPEFISNLALRLDPYSWIRNATAEISPWTRHREHESIRPASRGLHSHRDNETCATNANTDTPDLIDHYGFQRCVTSQSHVVNLTLTSQDGYKSFLKDSVREDRPFGSPGGEMELFLPSIHAPAYSIKQRADTWTRHYPVHQGHVDPQSSDSSKITQSHHTGPFGYVPTSSIDAVLEAEQSIANSLMNSHYNGMLSSLMPNNPVFDLAYNIGELKDLPMMLRNSTKLMVDRQKLFELNGQGGAYLNYTFGWRQLYQSIVDLLSTPEKVAKRVNWLLSRQGKRTNLHSRKKVDADFSVVPQFLYNTLTGESLVEAGVKSSHQAELRMALNAKIVLPDMSIPKLRRELTLDAWGALPRPADVYNLVPWTWLADWFTSTQDYVEILDRIYQDKSLFNYGYYSYVSKGTCNYTVATKISDTKSWVVDGENGVSTTVRKTTHNARFRWKYHKRIDLSTLPDLKAVSRPASLSGDQLAIIGALLTRFA